MKSINNTGVKTVRGCTGDYQSHPLNFTTMTRQESAKLIEDLRRAFRFSGTPHPDYAFIGSLSIVVESMLSEPTERNATQWIMILNEKILELVTTDPVSPTDLANGDRTSPQ